MLVPIGSPSQVRGAACHAGYHVMESLSLWLAATTAAPVVGLALPYAGGVGKSRSYP